MAGSNVSTTGPSGIGSEVLRRSYVVDTDNSLCTPITVGTDMVVTILSIVVTNTANENAKNLEIYIHGTGSSAHDAFLYRNIGGFNAYDTFVFSDRVVMVETDILKVESTSTDFDVYVSYIEQEFA